MLHLQLQSIRLQLWEQWRKSTQWLEIAWLLPSQQQMH